MQPNTLVVASGDTVVAFRQSLNWHAAATHVFALALERAHNAGCLTLHEASELFATAKSKMDVAEVRRATDIVLAGLERRAQAGSTTR